MKTTIVIISLLLLASLSSCNQTENTIYCNCTNPETHICPPCDCPPPVIQCDCPITSRDPIKEVMEMFLGMWSDLVNLSLHTVEVDRSQTLFVPHEDGGQWDRTFYLVTDPSFQSIEDIGRFMQQHTTSRYQRDRLGALIGTEWATFKEVDGRLYVNSLSVGIPGLHPSPRNIDFFSWRYFWNPNYPNRRAFDYFWQASSSHEMRLLFANDDFDPDAPRICCCGGAQNVENGLEFIRIDLVYENGWKIDRVDYIWHGHVFLWWR